MNNRKIIGVTVGTPMKPQVLKAGNNIDITNNVISVITTDDVEKDNTKPITSSAVYETVGNIEALLKTI